MKVDKRASRKLRIWQCDVISKIRYCHDELTLVSSQRRSFKAYIMRVLGNDASLCDVTNGKEPLASMMATGNGVYEDKNGDNCSKMLVIVIGEISDGRENVTSKVGEYLVVIGSWSSYC